MRFTDLHHHVLWGMDDGPKTPQEMHAMLEAAVKDGVGMIAATPHACVEHRAFDLALYERRIEEAKAYCRSRAWPLDIIGGCEILWCDRAADLLREGRLPMLGQTRYVLLEFYPDAPLHQIARAADRTHNAGCFPIVAHAERYRALRRSVRTALQFKEDHGLLYQMNCDTLISPRGFMQRLYVRRMLEERAIDLLASDAHDTANRPVRMHQAYEKAKKDYGSAYALELVTFGKKLLAGETAQENLLQPPRITNE